jgi:hypothetical protein
VPDWHGTRGTCNGAIDLTRTPKLRCRVRLRPLLRAREESIGENDALYYRGAVTYAGVRARNDRHQLSIDAQKRIHRLNGNIIIPSFGPTMILPFFRAVDQDKLRERPVLVPTGLPYASVGAGNAVVLHCACSSASVTA